jgi:hypothetical protein
VILLCWSNVVYAVYTPIVPVAVFVWETEAFRPGSDKGSTCSPCAYGCIIYAYTGTALENNAFEVFLEILTKELSKTVEPHMPEQFGFRRSSLTFCATQ